MFVTNIYLKMGSHMEVYGGRRYGGTLEKTNVAGITAKLAILLKRRRRHKLYQFVGGLHAVAILVVILCRQ